MHVNILEYHINEVVWRASWYKLKWATPWWSHVAGADPGIFLGGGALISCSTSTPINHVVFFLENTSCIRKPQVISRGGGGTPCTLSLDPPLCSTAHQLYLHVCFKDLKTAIFFLTCGQPSKIWNINRSTATNRWVRWCRISQSRKFINLNKFAQYFSLKYKTSSEAKRKMKRGGVGGSYRCPNGDHDQFSPNNIHTLSRDKR